MLRVQLQAMGLSGNGTGNRWVFLGSETASYAGTFRLQAGGASAGFGGSINMYGHSHASKPGDVAVGISSGSGGSFRVNGNGIDTGIDLFEVKSTRDIAFFDGSGSEAFYWDSSTARLGIGTTEPGARLNVAGALGAVIGGGASAIRMTNTDTSNYASISAGIVGTSNGGMDFSVDGTRRMVISGSGKVGIGTDSPSAPLSIDTGTTGTIAQFRGADTDILNIDGDSDAIVLDARNVAYLGFEMQGSEKMRIDSSGNVGINCTPVKKLQVTNGVSGDAGNLLLVNTNDTNGDTASLQFSMTDSDSFNKAGIFFERTTTQGRGSLHLANNIENNSNNVTKNDARLTIDSSGNVGIGVSPAAKFHVKLATNENIRFTTGGSGDTRISALNDAASATTQLSIQGSPLLFRGTNGLERMRIDSSGNVILQTVGAQLRFQNSLGPAPYIENSGEDASTAPYGQDLLFATGGSESMRILSGGGITFNGDTASANALDDYEEGTHDTTITCGTSGTITLGGSNEKLQYTKIGRLVTVSGRVAISGVSSPTGNFTMSLPFTIADLDDESGRSTGGIKIFNTSTNVDNFFFTAHEGNAFITVFKGGSTNGTSDSADTFSGNETIALSVTYVAS
jgi:hypothetical protein